MKYFISDTHFGHTNILRFERKCFKTIQEHDEFIFTLLEEHLRHDDVLYHLGDFGSLDAETCKRWKNLKGYKILIVGNHDTQKGKLKGIFDEVHNEPLFLKKRILLSHEPLPVTKGTLNVHGHLHGAKLDMPNYKNISLHVADYRLVSEKELIKDMMRLQKDSFAFLEEWYAEHYQFLTPNKNCVMDKNGHINLAASRKKLHEHKQRG